MISGKKVVIYGGAGFIGTHMGERLAANNELVLFDRDLAGPLRFSRLASDPAVRQIAGDVRDVVAVEKAMEGAEIVLHFASLVGVKHVIENARETIETILGGTANVLAAAARNPALERLVYISTSEVYGNVMDATEGVPASVGTGNDARLSYASAKLAGEHLVWAYHRDAGLPTVIVRPFNIFGPRRLTANAVGIFVVRALAGAPITLHGDGSQLRSWCYIEDFCAGMLAALEVPAAAGQDFNLGNPVTASTIYDLADRIVRLAGSSSVIERSPYTYNDIGVRAPNSSKAREVLGYVPRFDLDQGLRPTIDWHREHLDALRHWL